MPLLCDFVHVATQVQVLRRGDASSDPAPLRPQAILPAAKAPPPVSQHGTGHDVPAASSTQDWCDESYTPSTPQLSTIYLVFARLCFGSRAVSQRAALYHVGPWLFIVSPPATSFALLRSFCNICMKANLHGYTDSIRAS